MRGPKGRKGSATETSAKKTSTASKKVTPAKTPTNKADFVRARTHLSPKEIVEDAKTAGHGVREYFNANTERVADALLSITDEKAKRAKSGMVKGTYDKLRGSAKKNVEAAVPRLAAMIEKHAP